VRGEKKCKKEENLAEQSIEKVTFYTQKTDPEKSKYSIFHNDAVKY
jgi:hypothetical protein